MAGDGLGPGAIWAHGCATSRCPAGRRTKDAEEADCLIVEAEEDGTFDLSVAQHILELRPGIPDAARWLVQHSERFRKV
jgi:hypothetical protein